MHISTTYTMFFFSYQITYLGLVGGSDLDNTVWRVLKATFTTAVARYELERSQWEDWCPTPGRKGSCHW